MPVSLPFPIPAPQRRGPTVQELAELYCLLELPDLAKRPQQQRRHHLEVFCEEFGERQIDDLRKSDLKRFLQSHKEWKADDSKRNVCNAVKRLFAWAMDDERIDRNPFASVSWPESPPRPPMKELEFNALLRVSDAKFRRILFLLRLTGMRPDDVGNLDWPMVEWDKCRIVLDKHKTRKITRKPKKVYLPPLAVRLLRWLYARRLDDGMVFVNRRGNRFRSARLSQTLATARERAGLPPSCKLYGLRHKFGTDSQVAGNDIKTTAELMGHSSTRTTEKYYVDLSDEAEFLRTAAERVSKRKSSGQ